MRILHVADAHVDADRHGRRNPDTGRSTAIESNIECFNHVVDQAIALDVDAFVMPGDTWNTGRPTAEMIAIVTDRVRDLTRAGIPVIAEDGNHGRHGVHIHDRGPSALLEQAGALVYNTIGVHTIETKSGPLDVLTVPWPERSRILTELGMTDMTDPATVDKAVAGWVASEIEDAVEAADLSGDLIVTSHITVTAATLTRGSETVVNTRGIFEEVTLPLGVFTEVGAKYVALGHIHHGQHHGIASYAGSLNRLTFGEAEDDKGGLLVELTADGPKRTLIRTPARKMLNLRLDVNPDPNLDDIEPGTLIKAHLAAGERAIPDALRTAIRERGGLVVRTKTKPAHVDPAKRAEALAENVDPAIALAKWAESRGLDEKALSDLTARARLINERCAH